MHSSLVYDILNHCSIRFRLRIKSVSKRICQTSMSSLEHLRSFNVKEFLTILEIQNVLEQCQSPLTELVLSLPASQLERYASSISFILSDLPKNISVSVPKSIGHLSNQLTCTSQLTTLYGIPADLVYALQRCHHVSLARSLILTPPVDFGYLNLLLQSCPSLSMLSINLLDENQYNFLIDPRFYSYIAILVDQLLSLQIDAPSYIVDIERIVLFLSKCNRIRILKLNVANELEVWTSLMRHKDVLFLIKHLTLNNSQVPCSAFNLCSSMDTLTIPYSLISKPFCGYVSESLRVLRIVQLPHKPDLSIFMPNINKISKLSLEGAHSWCSLESFMLPMTVVSLEICNTIIPEKQLNRLSIFFPFLIELSFDLRNRTPHDAHPSCGNALLDLLFDLRFLKQLTLFGLDLGCESTFFPRRCNLDTLSINNCLHSSEFLYTVLPHTSSLRELTLSNPADPRELFCESLFSVIAQVESLQIVYTNMMPESGFNLRKAFADVVDERLGFFFPC
ncbi:hypothetical protein GEMRC1_002752 [Eukaryota sp. GEM-RC1]